MNEALAVGSLAYDTRMKRVGEVMEEYGTRYMLRPVHGGCEWDVLREHVRPATTADRLSAALAERNANSVREGAVWG
ncbi:hypothetical protein [Streptomyces jumonjinensis]|uniref:Uncharacterized protein n=2 Tax=Streptomyces jumonjinensis TaxID=1945 RepID=A0A646KT89_STRJU|nr:hypothetical protein [Streptomyces jumonjinensis]MQT05257.1 hypothetical protein [Streptomyces jumonjinensis]